MRPWIVWRFSGANQEYLALDFQPFFHFFWTPNRWQSAKFKTKATADKAAYVWLSYDRNSVFIARY